MRIADQILEAAQNAVRSASSAADSDMLAAEVAAQGWDRRAAAVAVQHVLHERAQRVERTTPV